MKFQQIVLIYTLAAREQIGKGEYSPSSGRKRLGTAGQSGEECNVKTIDKLSFKTADAKPSDMVTTPSPQPNCAEQ
jgi:hypothetical protein